MPQTSAQKIAALQARNKTLEAALRELQMQIGLLIDFNRHDQETRVIDAWMAAGEVLNPESKGKA